MRTKLKVLRVMNHLTQEQMAVECGCERQTYAAVEIGRLRGSESFWKNVQTRFDVANADMWELMQNEESGDRESDCE